MATYIVIAGDTLIDIAHRFNTTARALAELNAIANADLIPVGLELLLPDGVGPSTYVVQSGDTLGAIAQRFHTTVGELQRTNRIMNPDLIRVGQILVLPGAGDRPVAAPGSLRSELQRVIDLGRAEGWKPYSGPVIGQPDSWRWGHPGYDCSSFVATMYRKAFGIQLVGFTDAIATQTDPIPTSQALPGDIILYRYDDDDQPGVRFPHTGLWLGDGTTMLDCQDPRGLGVHALLNRPFEIHRARGIPASH